MMKWYLRSSKTKKNTNLSSISIILDPYYIRQVTWIGGSIFLFSISRIIILPGRHRAPPSTPARLSQTQPRQAHNLAALAADRTKNTLLPISQQLLHKILLLEKDRFGYCKRLGVLESVVQELTN
jgi:hypothetical protein